MVFRMVYPTSPPPFPLNFTPGQPRPAPPHSTLPEIVLSLDLWDLLKEMYNTRISAYVCVCLSLYVQLKGIVQFGKYANIKPGGQYKELVWYCFFFSFVFYCQKLKFNFSERQNNKPTSLDYK